MGNPRIAPGGADELRRTDRALARILGWAVGGGPPNVFTTLARHRGIFRRWLLFAGALMPGGRLPRAESELLILRVAYNCGSEYEWTQHVVLARAAGLADQEIAGARGAGTVAGLCPRPALLLRAADELHAERTISEELWAKLRTELSDTELIELCMLVGHYEMLAMTLNALRVEPDIVSGSGPPRALRALMALRERRRGRGRPDRRRSAAPREPPRSGG
jgi:alkylhydroperoxidase family enzyme